MAEKTEILWTDSTFNPWWGCQKVGPGCDHCYAETLDKRTGGEHWGPGAERRRTSAHNWNDPVRWNKKADEFFSKHGRRQRVFCASMADVFDNEVPREWRYDLLWLISNTPNLDWLLLTKRIGNAAAMLESECERMGFTWSAKRWPNVWLGATICNQEEADRDIPKLLAVSAAKRFLSMEPLLGPVDLRAWLPGTRTADFSNPPSLSWIIVGGESGPNARPMHPDWVRSLRDQCQAADVPFLFKQWGEFVDIHGGRGEWLGYVHKGKPDIAIHSNGRVQNPDFNEAGTTNLYRVGKKAAGRHLDGATWDEVPA